MYRNSGNGYVYRISDGVSIPRDPANGDYAAFLQWEAEGGVIEEVGESLAKLKAAKLVEINSKAEAVASYLTQGYPEFEMKTWPQQEAESMAFYADPSSATTTPMIDIMAAARGISREEYIQKTLAKVFLFRQASSKLVGLRQRFADQLNAATTAEAVAAINPVYSLA